MIDADQMDHDFFDILYQQWSKTTMAEDGYWMSEQDGDFTDTFNLYAISRNDNRKEPLAAHLSEADADFIAGLHGAVPDLIRRLHDAIDDAARKDEANDMAQGQLADALLENAGLREELLELQKELGR